MRGFRSSRGVQNEIASRFGQSPRNGSLNPKDSRWPSQSQGQSPSAPAAIPEWLKTPETKQLERRAQQPPSRIEAKVRPELQLVVDRAAKPKARTKAPAAKKRKAA